MAEIKLEITDEMIKSVVKEQVKSKIDKMDIKGMVQVEVNKCVNAVWREFDGNELVKQVKLAEVSKTVSDILSERIVHAFEEY